jgi:hypothetical protein
MIIKISDVDGLEKKLNELEGRVLGVAGQMREVLSQSVDFDDRLSALEHAPEQGKGKWMTYVGFEWVWFWHPLEKEVYPIHRHELSDGDLWQPYDPEHPEPPSPPEVK